MGKSESDGGRCEPARARPCEAAPHVDDEILRAIADGAADWQNWIDPSGKLRWVNPAVERHTGFSPAECLAMADFPMGLIDEADRDLLRSQFEGELRGTRGERVALRIVHKDGSLRWCEVCWQPIVNSVGTNFGYWSSLRDITDRKQAETLLWESEAKYRTLFENMTQGAFRRRADGVPTDVNPAALRMLGVEKDEFMGRTSLSARWDVIHEDGSSCPVDEYPSMRALKTGKGISGVVIGVLNRRSQDRVWMEVNAIPEFRPGEETPYQVSVTLHDITEWKRSEALIQESEERFRRTFDQAPIGAAIISLDYRFLRVNRAFCRISGYTEDQLLSLGFVDITHPDDLAEDMTLVRRLSSGEIDQYSREKRYLRPDGETMWVNVSARLLRDANDQPLYYLPMVEDITSRKLAEEEQQRLQQQLAHVARLSILGEMVAGIAHEVNQPLYSIVNYAKACGNILAQDPPNRAKLREWMGQIASEAVRAGEIIKRMRDLARKAEVRRLPTSIQDVIDESLALIAYEIRHLHVKVRKEYAEPALLANCDRVQIQQVLLNLLRNACEAMEQRPPIERTLTIRTAVAGEFAEVVIADSGPGLQDVENATIFDAFVTSKPRGLGMGLAIGKSIIEAHGGRIWATADPGGGAAFHFTLPSATGERKHVG